MAAFDTFEELGDLVDSSDGLVVVTAEQLRDAADWQRLTQGAIEDIANGLAQHGLGSFPPMEPGQRGAEVRVYRRGTALGNLVDAVVRPGAPGDRRLRETANNTAADVVARIRKMVCE